MADAVGRFGGILVERIELRNRQIDVLVASGENARERCPPSIEHPRHRFEVRRPRRSRAAALRGRKERSARKIAGNRQGRGVQERRQHVDVAHGGGRHFSASCATIAAELGNDERDVKRRFVGEQTVRLLAVLAKRLSMIAGDDDDRRPRGIAHIVEKRRERRVGRRYLAVVRLSGVLAVERRRRTVGRVRIEHVHPGEPAGAFVRADPIAREGHHGCRRPLGHDELSRVARFPESIVVDVEPLIQAETRVQRKGGDEGTGRVTSLLENRRERTCARREPIAAVLADAVDVRILTGENARVRWQRKDGLRMRKREADAFARKPVERGRRCRAAVRAERIRAQCVDRDEENILSRTTRGDRLAVCARGRTGPRRQLRERARDRESCGTLG